MFKITAAEKKLILKRRKSQGADGDPLGELVSIAKSFLDPIDNMDLDDMEVVIMEAEDEDNPIPDEYGRSVNLAIELKDKLYEVVASIANLKPKYGKYKKVIFR